jgi:hypothetical protein
MTTLPANRNIGNTGRQHIDDHEALHTAFNEQRFVVYAGALGIMGGGATLDAIRDYITMPNAGTPEVATGPLWLPDHWDTLHMDVIWFNAGATGNVRVQALANKLGADEVSGGYAVVASTTIIATSSVWGLTRVLTSYAVDDDQATLLYLNRQSADGADTLAGDWRVYGLIISKAS